MGRIEELISSMSVAEKALMCSGRKFWFTRGIKKYAIEPYMMTDGPHGLRKQDQSADNLGINDAIEATCFPPAVTLASSWNRDVLKRVGEAIGEEAKAEQVGIVLGPGMNIKRSPQCGRNFEYFSEDPYISGQCARYFIEGVQKNGTGTSIKHYAVNSQEGDRLRINAVVDERALREIYLSGFEEAITKASPYTVMCCYNKVNGKFGSESAYLMNTILREEWGFKGYVMTDWGAINDRVEGLKCGIDLEMPGGSGASVYDIINAVGDGSLDIETLNKAVKRLLAINFKVQEARDTTAKYSIAEHHQIAKELASEGAVLLKNDCKALPLLDNEEFVLIGDLAKNPRYQGNGSSLIKPNKLTNLYDTLSAEKRNFVYSAGYDCKVDKIDNNMIAEAVSVAKNSTGKVVVALGLTKFYESEGSDRTNIELPASQNALMAELIKIDKPIIVIMHCGAPVAMPWIGGVKSILNMYLAGQAIGEATADLLFGKANPSGKLAETFPIALADAPCHKYFPEGPMTVEYRESIFVGYRYYNTINKPVAFPFGHGLSYTTFSYSDIKLSTQSTTTGDISVTFTVTNTGDTAGKVVSELYIEKQDSAIVRAKRELKGYEKTMLNAGESKSVTIELDKRAFSYYNTDTASWAVEAGNYLIQIGASVEDIVLSTQLQFISDDNIKMYDSKTYADYFNPNGTFSDTSYSAILGHNIPSKAYDINPIRWETTPLENQTHWFGRLFLKLLLGGSNIVMRGEDENAIMMRKFMQDMMRSNTLRSMATTNGGLISLDSMKGLIIASNGKVCKGLCHTAKGFIKNYRLDRKLKKIEND
ncbi:MAG: glycoside hydrolase family 3 C-terminal domain-containing protein [Bacillota bacterium]